ncbi:MAG: hypothetical protein QM756_19975 [Polyangiaceae bacterium]
MWSPRWLALSLAVLCSTSLGYAESDAELEKAKALFEDARKLMADGKYESACGLLEQSLELARGIGTRFNLADCEERREHYVRAQQLFLEVAVQAREAGQGDREKVARDRAAAIDEKLSRLKFETEAPLVEIEIDGRKLSEEELKVPVGIEPGKHHVSVSAAGKQRWAKDIDVPKAGLFIIVNVPSLGASGAVASGAEPDKADAESTEASEPPPSAEHEPTEPAEPAADPNSGRGARRAAYIVGGIGVGAALAGAGFGLQYMSSNHDAKAICPSSTSCSQEDIAQHAKLIDDARTSRTWSYVGVGVGVAALSTAAILYFTSGPARVSATTGVNVDGSWNVSLRGRF